MAKKNFGTFVALTVALLLLWGIVRAATSRYEEQKKGVEAQCVAEQKRLGLTREALGVKYQKTLYEKYPTPEIALCRLVRLVPGGSAEFALKGTFAPGTKFLLDHDSVQVLNPTATATDYRATFKVPAGAGPGVAFIEAVTPVSCAYNRCRALYIGGKYEWDFTAASGWRVKLKMGKEEEGSGEQELRIVYSGEFYLEGQTTPFQVREVSVSAGSRGEEEGGEEEEGEKSGYEGYSGRIGEPKSEAAAEMQQLQMKMMDPNLSEEEREEVMEKYQALMGKLVAGDPGQRRKWKQEMGCESMSFKLTTGGNVEGELSGCNENVVPRGRVKFKGTMKYLGP